MKYSVSMDATAETYIYHVYCMSDEGVGEVELRFSDVAARWPGSVRNHIDALALVMAAAPNLYRELTDSE